MHLNRHTYSAHSPCPRHIARAGQHQMSEKVPLLKCNDLRSGPDAVQRELHRPEGGAGMLLPNRDLRTGSTNTGGSDGVQPRFRHLRRRAKAPDGAVEWPLLKKEDWPRPCLKEPVQLSVVFDLALQELRISVGLRGPCYRPRVRGWAVCGFGVSCWWVHWLRVFIDAPRSPAYRDQQAQGKPDPAPPVLHSRVSMVGKPAVQDNHCASRDSIWKTRRTVPAILSVPGKTMEL